ncbi:MAG TPA: hypothetical protein VMF11_09405 [Candidatus Baltobacteraceae bacterium]|nr:hypothetical protein [Candidatus Baltobacteraceae bacterium]
MRNRLIFTVAILGLSVLGAAAPRDGAVIHNSGSTNTAGYTITVRSDGTGTKSIQRGPASPFTLAQDVSERFFADLKAARENPGVPTHCMKSASFGTTTVVQWHGWTSPDLQCPPFSASVGALANDVRAIQSAAGITTLMRGRIGLPPSLRKIPPATPEVQPT